MHTSFSLTYTSQCDDCKEEQHPLVTLRLVTDDPNNATSITLCFLCAHDLIERFSQYTQQAFETHCIY